MPLLHCIHQHKLGTHTTNAGNNTATQQQRARMHTVLGSIVCQAGLILGPTLLSMH